MILAQTFVYKAEMKKKSSFIKRRADIVRKSSYTVKGVLKRHPEGFGFVIPEDKGHPDIYIPSTQIGSALSYDQVEALVLQKRNPKAVVGLIQSILKRDKEFAVGFIEFKKDQVFLSRHNLDFPRSLPLVCPAGADFKEGDYVKARILYQAQPSRPYFVKSFQDFPFSLELSKNLGCLGSVASDDKKRIMAEYDLPFEFSREALNQAQALPDEVRECDYEDRKDLRSSPFVTIDGASAQDFDDAIWVGKKAGVYTLYTAIADVSYYVEEGSPLDKSAFERGNSVYFPDFCIPMLPEKLSNNLCSLKENEDRLVMVQEMDFDLKGELLRSDLYPSVIKSQKRLTYTEVQKILDELPLPAEPTLSALSAPPAKTGPPSYLDSLRHAKSLTQILIQKHKKNQGFDLDIPETLIILDSRGETKNLTREKRLFSHKMIEHFMLACNQAVSVFLNQCQAPFIYRIHEGPKKTKLAALEMFAKSLSFSKSIQSRKALLSFLNYHKSHERTHLIHKLFLRSMSQARYSGFNKGHYGLNYKLYTHFTSPIRRYSDLIVHRLAKKALAQEKSATQEELEKKASWLSAREQKAVKAERRIKDIKAARFLKSHIGESFSGFVSSIAPFGIFITLEGFFVEGLVRFQEMRGFWEADELGLRAENKKNSYKIKFGDPVKVLITSVSIFDGQINLKLQTHKGGKIS